MRGEHDARGEKVRRGADEGGHAAEDRDIAQRHHDLRRALAEAPGKRREHGNEHHRDGRIVQKGADDGDEKESEEDGEAGPRRAEIGDVARGRIERACLEHALADNEQREDGKKRGIGETGKKRGRSEKVSPFIAGHGEKIEEEQQRTEDREGRDLERETFHAEEDDRGQNEAVGHPHLPDEIYLHARISSGSTMPFTAFVLRSGTRV